MTYDYFIGMVKHHQTNRIRAFTGSQQGNPELVPAAFALLMPDIMAILNDSINAVCNFDEGIVIFGLQPATGMIASNIPLEQGRSIAGLQPDYHFCCTLDFFKVAMSKIDQTETWRCTESMIIDFTSGEIMDSDRLLAKLHFLPSGGKLFGQINPNALKIAWAIAKLKQTKEKNNSFSFNSMFAQQVA